MLGATDMTMGPFGNLNEQAKTLIHNHDDDDDDDDCDYALWQKSPTVKLAFLSLKKSTHKGFVTVSLMKLFRSTHTHTHTHSHTHTHILHKNRTVINSTIILIEWVDREFERAVRQLH